MPQSDVEYTVPEVAVNLMESQASQIPQRLADRVGRGNKQTALLLAAGLLAAVAFATYPAWQYWDLATAPGWARLLLLVSSLQIVYMFWMLVLPDWSTIWIGMLKFALVGAVYALFWGLIAFSPPDEEMVLGLDPVRSKAAGWCAVQVLLMGMMSFIYGRIANRWRRAYELAKAGKLPVTGE